MKQLVIGCLNGLMKERGGASGAGTRALPVEIIGALVVVEVVCRAARLPSIATCATRRVAGPSWRSCRLAGESVRIRVRGNTCSWRVSPIEGVALSEAMKMVFHKSSNTIFNVFSQKFCMEMNWDFLWIKGTLVEIMCTILNHS